MIAAWLASMLMVALRAFQQLNVQHDRRAWVMPTSLCMAACECVIITRYAAAGFDLRLIGVTGLGAGVGCLMAMTLHKRLRHE